MEPAGIDVPIGVVHTMAEISGHQGGTFFVPDSGSL
jgi:hypothetical protein